MFSKTKPTELRREFGMRRHPSNAAIASVPEQLAWSGPADRRTILDLPDTRADSGARQVEIEAGQVVVERVIAGVKMRIAIPFTLYQGVALDVGADERGGFAVSVRLAHSDADLDVELFRAADDCDVTAEWQYWAARCDLPLLIAEPDGSYTMPFPRLGSLYVARPRQRRTPADFAARRPRFLVRRKVGRVAERPVVHHEREIIART
jgi:hypothetical protein